MGRERWIAPCQRLRPSGRCHISHSLEPLPLDYILYPADSFFDYFLLKVEEAVAGTSQTSQFNAREPMSGRFRKVERDDIVGRSMVRENRKSRRRELRRDV